MIRSIEAKSILSKLRGVDPYFGITYNMNLYRGCQHGCIYCDTRSECYRIGDISSIAVKSNAIMLLKRELSSKRTKATIGTGSMNDPYMPVEKETGLVRQALEVIAFRKYPVHIITKSDLVCRDVDILKEISHTYAAVSFTITTADNTLSGKIEPHAPSPEKRFTALYNLAKRGIYTGVTLMPMLPFINDIPENIITLLKQAKDAGAAYVFPMFGVTLRKGSREYFYNSLDEKFHGIKEKYQQHYNDKYECLSPAHKLLSETFYEWADRLGLEKRIHFYQPPEDTQLSLF